MPDGVFSVVDSACENRIIVCGDVIKLTGSVKKEDLDKAAKAHGIRNYVCKDEKGADVFVEDLPFDGTVKIVEYNAAKADGVFTVDPASDKSQIIVCGDCIKIAGAVKKEDLDKAAKAHGIRNYVCKDDKGTDVFVEDLPFTGTVKIVEYNAAKTA
jgi:peroxiredoxin family protein